MPKVNTKIKYNSKKSIKKIKKYIMAFEKSFPY